MPGEHDYDEKKHKERVKKLKAKTSKMRLAIFDFGKKTRKPNIIDSVREPGRQYTIGDSDYQEIWNNHYEYPNEDFIGHPSEEKYFGMDSGQRNNYNTFPENIKKQIRTNINENAAGGEYDSYFDERDMSKKERAKLPFKQKGEYT